MQPSTIRTLAELIAEHHRRNRYNYRTNSGSAVDTTIESDSTRDQGDRSRDVGCDQNHIWQSWD